MLGYMPDLIKDRALRNRSTDGYLFVYLVSVQRLKKDNRKIKINRL